MILDAQFSTKHFMTKPQLLTQTASVAAGLPYTIILCFVTIATWRALAMEVGDLNPYGPDFTVGLIDPFTMLRPQLWAGFLKNLFIA